MTTLLYNVSSKELVNRVKKLRKFFRKTVKVLPKQNLASTRVVLFMRERAYVLAMVTSLLVVQLIGAYIFNQRTLAAGQFTYNGTISSDSYNFTALRDVSVDELHNIYTYDASFVRKFDSAGHQLASWGSSGTNNGQFGPTNVYIATGPASTLYTMDTGLNRIQKFSTTGTYSTKWSSFGATPFTELTDISVDSAGYVYVIDAGHIQKFDANGGYQGEWGSVGGGATQFADPIAIATDSSNNVYVADNAADRIQKYQSDGTYIDGWGTYGESDPSTFDTPSSITIDGSNNVYVLDTHNNRLQKFQSNGNYVTEWVASRCTEIAADSSAGVYCSRQQKINSNSDATADGVVSYSPTGVYQHQYGRYGEGRLYQPMQMAQDSLGNMYVADTGNCRIQKFDPSGNYIAQWGSRGTSNGQFFATNTCGYSSMRLSIRDDVVYVEDYYNARIQKFTTAGSYSGSISYSGYIEGFTVDSDGNIYIATDANTIKKLSASGTEIDQWAYTTGSYIGMDVDSQGIIYAIRDGQITKFNSSGVSQGAISLSAVTVAPASPNPPVDMGIDVDDAGYIYAVYNNAIQKVDPNGNLVSFWGSAGSGNMQYTNPISVVAGLGGRLYVSDMSSNNVEIVNDTTYIIDVETKGASSITQTGATVSLATNEIDIPYGSEYNFQYGTTNSYGSLAAASSQGIVGTVQQVLSQTGWAQTRTYSWPDTPQETEFHGIRASDGSLYFADYYRVLKADINGNFAQQYSGSTGCECDSGLGFFPYNIAVNTQGDVYATTGSGYIHHYNAAGTQQGVIDFTSTTNTPGGIVTDKNDNLYGIIRDTNSDTYALKKYDNADAEIASWSLPSNTVAGSLAIDKHNNLYVIHGTVGNYELMVYDSRGNQINAWPVNGDRVVVDNSDYVYVQSGNTINVYAIDGSLTTTITATASGMIAPNYALSGGVEFHHTASEIGGMYYSTIYQPTYTANLSGLTCGTTYHYRAQASGINDTIYGADKTFTTSACPDPYVIVTDTLADGTVGVAYDQNIVASHTPSFIFVNSGSLPPGLSMSFDGHITGTPTAAGLYSFNVGALDNSGPYGEDYKDFTILVNAPYTPTLTITTATLPGGVVGTSYSKLLETYSDGGPNPVVFALSSGSLPPGLTLSESGLIVGTPTAEGTYSFEVFADNGNASTTKSFQILVTAASTGGGGGGNTEPPIEPPTVTDVTPSPAEAPAKTTTPKTSSINSPTLPVVAQNSIFALAKRIPEPIAFGFPWLLLLLALILVAMQYYQVHTESRATQRMQERLAHQKQLVDEQNNFVALSTHYLHTPLTVMEGEITLMAKAGTITQSQATKLKATLASLSAEAEAALAKEEQHGSNN